MDKFDEALVKGLADLLEDIQPNKVFLMPEARARQVLRYITRDYAIVPKMPPTATAVLVEQQAKAQQDRIHTKMKALEVAWTGTLALLAELAGIPEEEEASPDA